MHFVFEMDFSANTHCLQPFRLIHQNPAVDIGATTPLKLAINTAQYGRTFQDRSHVIKLSPRFTNSVPQDKDIYNLNVRGKRGNIVQVGEQNQNKSNCDG